MPRRDARRRTQRHMAQQGSVLRSAPAHRAARKPSPYTHAGLKRGGAFKLIKHLAKTKLVAHQSKPYDGYRLTFKGFDYLGLKTLSKRDAIVALGIQIGVGGMRQAAAARNLLSKQLVTFGSIGSVVAGRRIYAANANI